LVDWLLSPLAFPPPEFRANLGAVGVKLAVTRLGPDQLHQVNGGHEPPLGLFGLVGLLEVPDQAALFQDRGRLGIPRDP
jgi:hypothetical protein